MAGVRSVGNHGKNRPTVSFGFIRSWLLWQFCWKVIINASKERRRAQIAFFFSPAIFNSFSTWAPEWQKLLRVNPTKSCSTFKDLPPSTSTAPLMDHRKILILSTKVLDHLINAFPIMWNFFLYFHSIFFQLVELSLWICLFFSWISPWFALFCWSSLVRFHSWEKQHLLQKKQTANWYTFSLTLIVLACWPLLVCSQCTKQH